MSALGQQILGMSSNPGSTGLSSLGTPLVLYLEHNANGSMISALVLTNIDTIATGGTGRTVSVTLYHATLALPGFTSPPIGTWVVVPGVPQTVGVEVIMATGDSILGQSFIVAGSTLQSSSWAQGLVGIEFDGQVSPDPVSMGIEGLAQMMNEEFGTELPSQSQIIASSDSRT